MTFNELVARLEQAERDLSDVKEVLKYVKGHPNIVAYNDTSFRLNGNLDVLDVLGRIEKLEKAV